MILTCCFALAMAATAHAQVGFDRPGGDYTSYTVRNGDPAQCALRCERDAKCRAWSFNFPTAHSAATCWLKSAVPPRVESLNSVSGVRGAAVIVPRSGAVEFGIDRAGGDYRNFELPHDPTGLTCKAACEADNRCRAWSYLRPGYAGSGSRCYLKDRVKPPRPKPCCISGVVR